MKTEGTEVLRGARHAGGVKGEAGFSLAELLLVCLLGSLAGGLVLGLLLVLQRSLVPQRLVHEGETMAQAPCFETLPAALALHEVFRSQLGRSTAAYVFGGRIGGVSEEWAGGRVLSLRSLPLLGAMERGLPMDSGTFAEVQAGSLGGALEGQGAEDFSVLLLGRGQGAGRAICLVQCRSTLFEAAVGGQWKRREVRLWAEEGVQHSYVFAEAAGAASFCGALHSWYRPWTPAGDGEEGPATLVFPDPWVFAGGRGDRGEDPAGSRFSYFLPIFP